MNDRTLSTTAGVILAGTHPWTNSPFDRLMPRALVPVANRPLYSYALSWLRDGGIRHAAVVGNRETQELEHSLLTNTPHGMRVTYHADAMPRGAAGSLRDAALACDAHSFVVAAGTGIPAVDLEALLASHRSTGAAVTIVVHIENRRFGNPGLPVPCGIYVFERRAIEQIPVSGFYDIKEKLIPQLHRLGEKVSTFEATSATPHVFEASTYLAVNEWMLEQLAQSDAVPHGYVRDGLALVHTTARVADGASLIGPVMVASGARVESGAIVVGPCSIGCDATVEAGAFVSRSAIWRRATVGRGAAVDSSLVADDAVIEAAAQVAHAVHVETVRPAPLNALEASLRADVTVPVRDFGRRVTRLLTGAAWSRTPAAQ